MKDGPHSHCRGRREYENKIEIRDGSQKLPQIKENSVTQILTL